MAAPTSPQDSMRGDVSRRRHFKGGIGGRRRLCGAQPCAMGVVRAVDLGVAAGSARCPPELLPPNGPGARA